MSRGEGRKVRSDKKKDVKPILPIELKDAVYRLAYITYTPVKDTAEQLCIAVIHDVKSMNTLSQHFKRDVRFNNTIYMGNVKNPTITKRIDGDKSRLSVRFTQNDYETITAISYALDCSRSCTVANLIKIAMNDIKIVNSFVKNHLHEHLTKSQINELKALLQYINATGDEHHSWSSLISQIFDEVNVPVNRIKEAITAFFKS